MPHRRATEAITTKTRLRHLVVVVPGIGGSMLERAGRPVWGQSVAGIAARALSPGMLERFDGDGIRAVGHIRSPAVLPGFSALRSYDELLRRICNRFDGVTIDDGHPDHPPVAGADVLVTPYDFRQSIVDCAGEVACSVRSRLEGLSPAQRRRRVIVVAHSMGGLVARWWLGPGGAADVCRALVTLGTPHRGAPKALDWLVRGVRLRGVPLPGATTVIRTWSSAYELLPRYEAVLDTATGRHLRPHEIVAPGFEQKRARRAHEVHEAVEVAWQALADGGDGPTVHPFVGRFQPTPDRAELDGAGLHVEKRAADWLRVDDWAGDGTVPHVSAVPLELDDGRSRPSPDIPAVRHSAIPTLDRVVDLIEGLERHGAGHVRGRPGMPTLGLDVEEWHPAGEPVRIEAALRDGNDRLEDPGRRTKVWATVRAAAGAPGPRHEVELRAEADGRWVGEVPGLAPGHHEVEISAPGRAGGEPRPVREIVEAVGL